MKDQVTFEHVPFQRGRDRFAFASQAQAKKWFSPRELDWYKQKGYNLTKLDNVKIVGRGKTQVT